MSGILVHVSDIIFLKKKWIFLFHFPVTFRRVSIKSFCTSCCCLILKFKADGAAPAAAELTLNVYYPLIIYAHKNIRAMLNLW